jgi:hypothetical protein
MAINDESEEIDLEKVVHSMTSLADRMRKEQRKP